MLSRDENELLTRVSPETPMGETLRRYWMPVLLSWELPAHYHLKAVPTADPQVRAWLRRINLLR